MTDAELEQRIAEIINESVRNTDYVNESLGWKMTCVNAAKNIVKFVRSVEGETTQ